MAVIHPNSEVIKEPENPAVQLVSVANKVAKRERWCSQASDGRSPDKEPVLVRKSPLASAEINDLRWSRAKGM